MGIFGFVYALVTVLAVGSGWRSRWSGLPLLAAGPAGRRLLGRLERARARALLGGAGGRAEPHAVRADAAPASSLAVAER